MKNRPTTITSLGILVTEKHQCQFMLSIATSTKEVFDKEHDK